MGDFDCCASGSCDRTRAGLASVIEKAKAVDNYDESRRYWEMLAILAAADTDAALREIRAKAWAEGLHVAYNHVDRLEQADAAGQGVMIPDPVNPYREGK